MAPELNSHKQQPRELGLGVVGLGLMGERHCRVIQAVSGARLAGVCDATPEVAVLLADKCDTAPYETFDQMLAAPGVDVIVICLPSALHAEFGVRAAMAGKHVVVEKPVDARSDQAERLVRECDARELICATISQNRYSRGLQAMKWALDSRALENPVLARATVKWFRHDEYYTGSRWRGRREGEYGGVLINQAVHSVDTFQWLFGLPEAVGGFLHESRPDIMETEDTAVAIFHWQNGMVASLEASTSAAPGFDEAYEIHSSSATIRVVKGEVDFWWHKDGIALPEELTGDTAAEAAGDNLALDAKLQLFARQYENIIAAIRGEADLDVPPHQAVEVVRTIERIYKAAGRSFP